MRATALERLTLAPTDLATSIIDQIETPTRATAKHVGDRTWKVA